MAAKGVSAALLATSNPAPMDLTTIRSDAPCELWLAHLDAPIAEDALACLSTEERARADRFAFARDRHRYISAHVALRRVLSAAVDCAANELSFELGPAGKPRLADHQGCQFNLSHSDQFGLVAVSHDAEIGVDLEVLRPMPDWSALARAHFSPAEFSALAQTADARTRDKAFLFGWTRKEAGLKAIGIGLDHDLRAIEAGVSADAGELSVVIAGKTIQLSLHSFAADGLFVGSVACVRGRAPAMLQ